MTSSWNQRWSKLCPGNTPRTGHQGNKMKHRYIFPVGHCPENITNTHVSAYCRQSLGASWIYTNLKTAAKHSFGYISGSAPWDTPSQNSMSVRQRCQKCCLSEINTLRPRQNGRRFADDILKCIFLNENAWILLKISLKFVPKVRINNIPALVQIMAWRRPGDKPLSEPKMVSLLTHICVARPQWVKGQKSIFCCPETSEKMRMVVSKSYVLFRHLE